MERVRSPCRTASNHRGGGKVRVRVNQLVKSLQGDVLSAAIAALLIFGPFAQTTTHEWRKVMGTDLDGVMQPFVITITRSLFEYGSHGVRINAVARSLSLENWTCSSRESLPHPLFPVWVETGG